MKRIITLALVTVAMLAGCSKNGDTSRVDNSVKFSSAITANSDGKTRVAGEMGDAWSGGEEIGIYMYTSTLADNHPNAFYRTAGTNGDLTPAGFADELIYPEDGGNVNFVAYYPYHADLHTAHGNVYPIDVADQSKEIDFMYAPVKTQGVGKVKLQFSHKLCRLVFFVTDVMENDLADMTTVIGGLPTTAGFNLAAASPAISGTGNILPITARLVSVTDRTARVEAVVLPGENLDFTVTFTLANGIEAALEMEGENLLPGEQYRYNVTITDPDNPFYGKNLVTFGNSITAWNNSWAQQINTKLEFGHFYNGAIGGAMWLKRTRTANNDQSVTTQDYTDSAFAGFGNQWNSTDPVELQKVVNNAAIVHIQKYLAERDPAKSPDFIILAYGTNDPSDATSLGDAQTALQENNPDNLDLFTIAGALKWSLVTLRTNFPEAKIYVLLPIQCGKGTTTLTNRFNGNLIKIPVITAVCEGLEIPYFDCWNESGITAENAAQYTSDGLHPNTAGQALHTEYVISKLQSLNKRQ